ncbi:hypothetical protein [Lihuaxuella thermophila]|uniref:Uncharacterized protein n=1 Tax=Lihuaxuella thermophila TaxID=1173111 RepID=A0A1H8JB15_9BACL|nr:hypothetical protein [Lihuaxuella thermophila]SEN77615.1 hypothetical protein SAMN05444955_1238 [Lihuaxuella thermophila]
MANPRFNPGEEWTDGELAEYPTENDPATHVTAGIQEAYSLNPHITDNVEEMKRGHADPSNYEQKHK